MNRSRVSVFGTSPATVLDDYGKLMRKASYTGTVKPGDETVLAVDLSWHHFFPSVSTTPWQLDGVLKTLIDDGFAPERLSVCYGWRDGVSTKKGEVFNRFVPVLERYGIGAFHLSEGERWIRYEPKTALRILPEIFPEGIYIPERLSGKSVILLPTMKTEALSIIAGALYTCFETLFDRNSTRAYGAFHEALADAFTIAGDVFGGIFTVMDGVFTGEGPGPLSYMPNERNLLLASSDPVALDAVAAFLMGIDPLSIPFIRLAHEDGLGTGDLNVIDIDGEDISSVRFAMNTGKTGMDTRLRLLEKGLAGSLLRPLARILTVMYSDFHWYVRIGEKRIRTTMKGEWLKVFEGYRKKTG
ncbi:DUF362 domain-containing protein [bacterium]|nr:DUF362 domain-containing protein [bacterium]